MSVRRAGPWLLVALFALSLPTVTSRIYASDEVQYFAYLRSLWFDRDVSFENEYRYFDERGIARSEGFHETFLERQTDTGHRINFATIGCAVLWLPFYAIGDVVARVSGSTPDGYSRPYVAAIAYGSAVYGFLALLLSARTAGRWLDVTSSRTRTAARLYGAGDDASWSGTLAAFAVWAGTPLLFYMYIAPPMSHACSAFAVSAFIAMWMRVRERWSLGGLAALGAMGALMAMVREQDAFFIVGPAIDMARAFVIRPLVPASSTPGALTLATRGLAAALVALAVYTPQALAYQALNGYVGPSPLVARKMTWTAPHLFEVAFSSEHGLVTWTPLVVLALLGLLAVILRPPSVAGDFRWVAALLLLMMFVQLFVVGSVESWTGAGGFGQRRFVALSAILVLGLAALWMTVRSRVGKSAVAVLVAVCVWWNVGLTVQFGAGLMDRQRLEPLRNAYVTFVVLPRELPKLAARYFFERDTFYRTGK
jgi:hypothetical protein